VSLGTSLEDSAGGPWIAWFVGMLFTAIALNRAMRWTFGRVRDR
jgi:hypothetical protein